MSLIRKHGAVLQAWACLDLVYFMHIELEISAVTAQTYAERMVVQPGEHKDSIQLLLLCIIISAGMPDQDSRTMDPDSEPYVV